MNSVIQLFQITLSDQSRKLENKTARLCGIFFLNEFIKKPAMPRPYSEDLRFLRLCKVLAVHDFSVLSWGVRPHCLKFYLAQENISELYSVPVLTD